jgi:hypothetical protein
LILNDTHSIRLSRIIFIPSKFCYFRPPDHVILMAIQALDFRCQCTQQKLQSICAVLMFDPQLKKILTFSVKDRYQLNYFICIKDMNTETNRFLHTFLGKTGWSSTSDRKISITSGRSPGLSQQRMQVPISSVNQQLSLSRTPRDPRHWSVTNLHKLSDQYHKIERYEIHIT